MNINNSKIKETAYKSLVRPTVEYASSVWDPYHQNNKYRLEMVQRRAVRYVTNRHHNASSVGSMIEDLNWKSLEDRRKIAKLAMMYKLVNGLVLVNTEDRLIPPDRIFRIYSKPFQVFLFSLYICKALQKFKLNVYILFLFFCMRIQKVAE